MLSVPYSKLGWGVPQGVDRWSPSLAEALGLILSTAQTGVVEALRPIMPGVKDQYFQIMPSLNQLQAHWALLDPVSKQEKAALCVENDMYAVFSLLL